MPGCHSRPECAGFIGKGHDEMTIEMVGGGLCVFAAVPGPAGRLHPAGVGEGSRVSVGQQPGAGGRVPLPAGPSLQPAGGDPQPRLL